MTKANADRTPRRTPATPDRASGRVHLYVGISLDGYLADRDGGVAWLEPYPDALAGFEPFRQTIGAIVMGRRTYDHAVTHGFADFGPAPAYVVTHRRFDAPSPSVIPYVGELPALVEELRRRHPGDIWLMGGGQLARAFHEADLVDLWTIGLVPTLLGDGLPMFPPARCTERRLRLVRTHTYPSGVIELRYQRR